jgi:hypothetical protein
METDNSMTEPIDVFSDQFQLTVGPYGCTVSFMMSPATPPVPGSMPQAERLASVRMSLEHLKVMAFMLRRQLMQYERGTGTKIQLPLDILNSLQIGPEDWNAFWQQE